MHALKLSRCAGTRSETSPSDGFFRKPPELRRAPADRRRRAHAKERQQQGSDVANGSITVTLKRPLGLNLREDAASKSIVIESIEQGSNADMAGVFAEGDTLVACSAVMMVTEAEAKTGTIYDRDSRGRKGGCCSTGCSDCPFNHRNWHRVMFDCRGKNFETVIAALQSNFQARWLARGHDEDVSITVSVER